MIGGLPATRFGAICGLTCILWSLALSSVAAQEHGTTGEIAGRVVDFDGLPLPGTPVRALGADGSERSRIADENAEFIFEDLPPGVYTLSIDLPGIRVEGDTTLEVKEGLRVSTTLKINLFATNVDVRVTARVPVGTEVMDTDSTSGSATVPYETLDRLPLRTEQVLDFLPLLPSVIRDARNRISIDGTLPTDSMLLFNGIDLIDPFSGEYRLRLPLEAVDTIQVFKGVYPATYGQLQGGVIDVSTAPGGPEWTYKVSSFVPSPNFNGGTLMGVKRASPRLRIAGPLGDAGRLALSGEYNFNRIDVDDVPGNPLRDDVRIQGWEVLGQLDWTFSDRHKSRILMLAFPQNDDFVGLDGHTPIEATTDVERDAEALEAQHEWRINNTSALDLMVQYNRIGIASTPKGFAPLEVTPDGVRGNAFHDEDRQTTHFEAKGIYTSLWRRSPESSHLFEIGGEVHHLDLDGRFGNRTILVRGVDDRLLQRIEFLGGEKIDQDKFEWAAFIQDRWSSGDRFWVDVGMRYSSDSLTHDPRYAPRLGVAWDPTGSGSTLIKAAAGLLYRRLYIGEALWEQLPARVELTPTGADAAQARVMLPELTGQLSAPWSWLATVELNHRFSSDLLVRSRYSLRQGRDQLIVDRHEAQGFVETSLATAPTDLAAFPESARGALTLANEGTSTSWSVELSVNYRFGDSAEIFAAYVRSSADGDLNDFSIIAGEIPEPIIRPNRRGRLPIDAPHRLLAWGTIKLPWSMQLAPVFEWRSGFPYSIVAEDQSYVGSANSERFPAFISADAQVTKEFTIAGHGIRAGAGITNFTNHLNPRQVIANVASPRFGELLNGVPLTVRLKVSFLF